MTSPFLRRVLLADAVVSGAAGVAMIIGGRFLAPLLHLPEPLLATAGAALMPWFAGLIALARMGRIPRQAVRAVVAMNLAWVLGSVAVLFALAPSILGYAFVIAQAVAVGLFAELQMLALRREPGAA